MHLHCSTLPQLPQELPFGVNWVNNDCLHFGSSQILKRQSDAKLWELATVQLTGTSPSLRPSRACDFCILFKTSRHISFRNISLHTHLAIRPFSHSILVRGQVQRVALRFMLRREFFFRVPINFKTLVESQIRVKQHRTMHFGPLPPNHRVV